MKRIKPGWHNNIDHVVINNTSTVDIFIDNYVGYFLTDDRAKAYIQLYSGDFRIVGIYK